MEQIQSINLWQSFKPGGHTGTAIIKDGTTFITVVFKDEGISSPSPLSIDYVISNFGLYIKESDLAQLKTEFPAFKSITYK